MSRRLIVEPLEDRTGLSAAPAAPFPPPPLHHEQTALVLLQPVSELRLTSHATVIENDISDGHNDPVQGDGSYNWFDDSSFPNTLGDYGHPDGYTQNSLQNRLTILTATSLARRSDHCFWLALPTMRWYTRPVHAKHRSSNLQ